MSKCHEVRIKGDLCGINEADIREELEARGWTPVRVEFSRPERCFLVRFQNAVGRSPCTTILLVMIATCAFFQRGISLVALRFFPVSIAYYYSSCKDCPAGDFNK